MSKLHNASHIPSVNGERFTENINDNATFEDQESFQDQEKIHHYRHCNETLLRLIGEDYCLDEFYVYMLELGKENWCDWEMVLSRYNFLTHCLETFAGEVRCYYPNAVVQEMFVDVHREYFSSCGTKEEVLQDAPAGVVLVLTLLPVSVIPVLVYMVIWKSSVID
ncbi:Receptor activity-modifying protein 1 [Bagarius yarrelli]|uniref:Receptor activity-modifying protein 1 n=1 Tax=Bagarius yarrelli TaxID=175774 RepID=A0A556U1F4_BAGYA|nr:Receptor activity-modifying protein 1 [Bagarius yarrelli]